MSAADVLTVPFEWGAALRDRKLFHPAGIVVSGTLDRLAATGEGLPVRSGAVIARFSKGVGTPGAVPDIAGLAWRMKHDTGPWDLLAVSVARIPFGRIALAPLTSWSDATFSTLMPLRFQGELWWVRARITTPIAHGGLSLDTVSRVVQSGGIQLVVEQARGVGEFLPLAHMVLAAEHPDADVSFDPVRNEADDVRLTPAWLTDLRRAAYRHSRQGRADQRPDSRFGR